MGIASRSVVAGFGVAAPLRHDERFLVADIPGSRVGSFCMLLVPADVLVGANDVERLPKWIVNDLCCAAAVGVFFCANQKRGSDQARRVEFAGEVGHGGEVFCAGFGVGGFVGDRPEDDGGLVAIATNHLGGLLFGLGEYGGGVGRGAPEVGDFGPDHEAETVCSARHALVVRVVGEADVVAA